MSDCGSLELAAARLGARWDRRADAAAWRRLDSARSLAAALEVCRGCGLAPWVEGLTAATAVHTLEQALRRRCARFVDELAGWMPAPWQAAVRWCGVLPELPLVRHLAAGEPPPPWLDADAPARERWLDAAPSPRRGTAQPLVRGAAQPLVRGAFAALRARAEGDPAHVVAAWQSQWHDLAPPGSGRDAIEALSGRLWPAHREALRQPGADTHALRQALQTTLVAQWRRAPLEPLAAFVHVALLMLEFERLRGELAARAAFPGFPLRLPRAAPGHVEIA
jgi:hypothetical protein